MANLTNEQIEQLLQLLQAAGIDRTIVGKVMPLHKGEYDPLEIYAINDIVSYHGSSYWKYNPIQQAGIIPVDQTVWRQLTDASAVEEYVERAVLAANRAETAQTGAETAQAAAEDAEEGAQAAQTAAEAAQTAAESASETAQGYAGDASASASGAAQSAQDAENAATGAQASATTASNAAVSASASAADATSSATDAYTSQQAAEAAQEAAETAEAGAESAVTDAVAAKDAAVAAKTAAETAKTDAIAAKTAAETAQAGAESAEDGAEAAQAAAEAAAALVADMALMEAIAPKYSSTTAYKIGNLLTYLGKQYYCIADAPAGTLPTNTTYFEEKSVADIIEMIKNGSIKTGHSKVADNLTPYSEDSGTTQENPFISQGTGTNNNSEIVTTGKIARQLEKQGNTVGKNQLISIPDDVSLWTKNGATITDAGNGYKKIVRADNASAAQVSKTFNVTVGHKYLCIYDAYKVDGTSGEALIYPTSNLGNMQTKQIPTTKGTITSFVLEATTGMSWMTARYYNWGSGNEIYAKSAYVVDLTQWGFSSDIITDLTSHPEHFSWYYNGSLAYDAGSLQNCNGRYLECGQGRNLFDQEMELGKYSDTTGEKQSGTGNLRSKNKFLVVPNKPIYFRSPKAGYFYFYDASNNFVGNLGTSGNTTFTVPANACFMAFYLGSSYGTTYNHDVSVEEYYTPEQGGEGYGEMHDYIAPIRIDTGNETLKAFDKKLPSGVIERNGGNYTCGASEGITLDAISGQTTYRWYFITLLTECKSGSDIKSVCSKLAYLGEASTAYAIDKVGYYINDGRVFVKLTTSTKADAQAFLSGMEIQYELADASKTTEQGTSFSEYAPINDYSYMAWFDSDGNLVSIPQGCKLFYPVDYKGFTDDLVMYTNGDATALAKNEDITDSALNARGYYKMQDLLTAFGANGFGGGTLRQQLAKANNIEVANTSCVNMKDLSWVIVDADKHLFRAELTGSKTETEASAVPNILTSGGYKTVGASTCYGASTDMLISKGIAGIVGANYLLIVNRSCSTVEEIASAVQYHLVAFEKA